MEILGTDNQDIRWKQRFQNYEKAFNRLSRAIEIVRITPDDDLLQSGLVQTYEYTFELAWKTLKDYLEMEGFLLRSPRETIRQGFQSGYITNAEDWLQALALWGSYTINNMMKSDKAPEVHPFTIGFGVNF